MQMYLDNNKNPVNIRMRFAINWAPKEGSRVHLQQIAFPNLPRWDAKSLDFETTQLAVEIGSELGTFVPRFDQFIEFDIRRDLLNWLERCNTGPDCRYISFRLYSSDPHWFKVYSKEASKESNRPQLIFSEGSYALSVPIVADTGVVRQLPDRGFGHWPTLDLILYTHVAFMEFNLLDVLSRVQSIHVTTGIKIRLWVEWAQAAWGTVTAEVVSVGKPLDETSFRYIDTENGNVVVLHNLGTMHVCSSCFIEFDLTPLLTKEAQTAESTEKRVAADFSELRHFQIRLRTEQNAWVKFASKEYHDLSKRQIGRAVQQECRDRSRMPSSA
eukprot:TRINITY_DN23916_c0_g1_i1.p1 TRINITY_DN23916_c0_g1~~TRINITY_DN23916_c0_g1_i1.p1  ORF type:complete len:328 (+),score=39.56 TRINITY_DN23916_c0_g1_i1:240-1223(+)